jgi:hypothetical protein
MNSQPLIDTASSLVGSGIGLLEGLIFEAQHRANLSANSVFVGRRNRVPMALDFGPLKRHALGKPIGTAALPSIGPQ